MISGLPDQYSMSECKPDHAMCSSPRTRAPCAGRQKMIETIQKEQIQASSIGGFPRT